MKKDVQVLCMSLLVVIFAFIGCDNSRDPGGRTSQSGEVEELLEENGVNRNNVLDLTQDAGSVGKRSKKLGCITLVKIGGLVNHFGVDITVDPPQNIPYQNVPDTKIWFSEFPFSRYLNIRTDEEGFWELWIIKFTNIDVKFSLVYEKEGWITTKSNVLTITDEDKMDIAVHFIDPLYYTMGVKPMVEGMLGTSLDTAMVATIGKSWATLFEDKFPHGDPGALALINGQFQLPGVIGPIYFNEDIVPDITQTSTSVDGGVTWINQPVGNYNVTGYKEGVEYDTVTFDVTAEDAGYGVVLYMASPPNSIQGTNDSGPGEF